VSVTTTDPKSAAADLQPLSAAPRMPPTRLCGTILYSTPGVVDGMPGPSSLVDPHTSSNPSTQRHGTRSALWWSVSPGETSDRPLLYATVRYAFGGGVRAERFPGVPPCPCTEIRKCISIVVVDAVRNIFTPHQLSFPPLTCIILTPAAQLYTARTTSRPVAVPNSHGALLDQSV
jgi:hypothetical protein